MGAFTYTIPLSKLAGEAKSSTSGNIILGAGKWLVIYNARVRQNTLSQVAVTRFTFTDDVIPPGTWAAGTTSGQNHHAIVSFSGLVDLATQKTIIRSTPTYTNTTIITENWVAIPVNA